MKVILRVLGVMIVLLGAAFLILDGADNAQVTAQTNNIHMRYFEVADTPLEQNRFQIFSFGGLANEEITIVVHGVDNDAIPSLTLFDPLGVTLAENLNPNGEPIVSVQVTLPETNVYTFVVSRQDENSGTLRALIHEGEPLAPDRTLLDTVDPFLPGRGFVTIGDPDDRDEGYAVRVTSDPENEDDVEDAEGIYAARGTSDEIPPLAERIEPTRSVSWFNTGGVEFYTLSLRPRPDPLPAEESRLPRGFGEISANNPSGLSFPQQVEAIYEVVIELGEGGVPEDVPRPICNGSAVGGAPLLEGPSPDFPVRRTLAGGEPIEILATSGEYFLIVDTQSATGGSYILQSDVTAAQIGGASCVRVQEVDNPPPAPAQSEPNTGGPTAGDPFGIPPAGDPPDDAPPPGGGGPSIIREPSPTPLPVVPPGNPGGPNDPNVTQEPGGMISISCGACDDGLCDVTVIWTNVPQVIEVKDSDGILFSSVNNLINPPANSGLAAGEAPESESVFAASADGTIFSNTVTCGD
ncbi:MAG: hypothetical protein ACLFTK_06590 [Anaerolineales bacterium]